ncbi:MAG: hypothetical protein IJW35_06805 [Lentisphaeria bacterium]|nr:hypothetical protein [Lentisphaeria bacterium]
MGTLFLSHRGESDDAPENTLEAFQLAMERDSDGIELDLRLTADKQVICFHDETLERIAQVPLAVADHPLAELLKYHDIPLFAEALALLGENKHLQIEMKGAPAILPFARQILDEFPGRNRFAISSFEKETIRQAADHFPDLPRVLLTDLRREFGRFPAPAEVVKLLAPLQCGISFKADFAADREFVQELHRAGLRVVCWGVSSDELGLAMAAAGVDALTCNHAVALRQKYLLSHLL